MSPIEALTTVLFALSVPIIMGLFALTSVLFNWLSDNIRSIFTKGKHQ